MNPSTESELSLSVSTADFSRRTRRTWSLTLQLSTFQAWHTFSRSIITDFFHFLGWTDKDYAHKAQGHTLPAEKVSMRKRWTADDLDFKGYGRTLLQNLLKCRADRKMSPELNQCIDASNYTRSHTYTSTPLTADLQHWSQLLMSISDQS